MGCLLAALVSVSCPDDENDSRGKGAGGHNSIKAEDIANHVDAGSDTFGSLVCKSWGDSLPLSPSACLRDGSLPTCSLQSEGSLWRYNIYVMYVCMYVSLLSNERTCRKPATLT